EAPDHAAVQLDLVHALQAAGLLQLQGAIRGEHDERREAVRGLDDGREVVRGGAPRGREHDAGAPAHARLPEREEPGAALVHDGMTPKARGRQRRPGERRRARAGAHHDVLHPGSCEASEEQARPFGEQVLRHPETPSAPSSAASFQRVSTSSLSGSEPATIPQPAYRESVRSTSTPERNATTNSPSPRASKQPSGPAYQPR